MQLNLINKYIAPIGGKTIKYDVKGTYKSNYSSWVSYYTLTTDTIGAYTVQYNYLDVLEITDAVQEISNEAFQSRTTIKDVIFPKSMRKIGDRAFKGCSNISAVTMPETVTTLGDSAFENCSKLTSINIPTNITKLPSQIFYGCTSLERVDLPQSVTTLGGLCFYMSKVGNIDEILTNITTIEEAALGNLKNPNVTSITIPDNVTTIGSKIFNYNSYLQSVTLPSTLTAYTSTMFGNCSALTSITLLGTREPSTVHADMFKNLTTQGTLHLTDAIAENFPTVVSLLPEGWTVIDKSGRPINIGGGGGDEAPEAD